MISLCNLGMCCFRSGALVLGRLKTSEVIKPCFWDNALFIVVINDKRLMNEK